MTMGIGSTEPSSAALTKDGERLAASDSATASSTSTKATSAKDSDATAASDAQTSSSTTSRRRTHHTTATTDTSSTTNPHTAVATPTTDDTLSTSSLSSSATDTCNVSGCTVATTSTILDPTYTSSTLPLSTTAASTTVILAAAATNTSGAVTASSSHHSGLLPGAIAATVVVPVVVLAALAAFLVLYLRQRRSRRAFVRQSSPSIRSDPPSPVGEDEKPFEKELELSYMEHIAPTLQVTPTTGLTIPRRPVGLEPAVAEPQLKPLTSESSFLWTPSDDSRMTAHHASGKILLPTLPEVHTGHFFNTPRGSFYGQKDPFNNPNSDYTPSPTERSQLYRGNRDIFAASEPSPITHTSVTMQPQSSVPPTPIRPTQSSPSPTNFEPPRPTGLYPPALRTSGEDSDRSSMVSAGEEDGNDELGTVEYASAARVAQVAQVVSGTAGREGEAQPGTHNRRSVGLISVKPGGRDSMSHVTQGSSSRNASGNSSPVF